MSSNTARDALATRRQTHAVLLRSCGLTYQAIADSVLPCPTHTYHHLAPTEWGKRSCKACRPMYANRSSAKRAVDAALEQEYAAGADTREQLRRAQLAQLDALLARTMVEALGFGDGHLEAGRNAVRYLDRRAKLLGLDAPARLAITSELDQQILELTERLAGNDEDVPVDADAETLD